MPDPQVDNLYCAPGTVVTTPEIVTAAQETSTIFNWAGVRIHAPSIPIPRVHAYYRYGPLGRDLDHFGSDYDHYIVMDYIEGETADQAWPSLNDAQKLEIANQLSSHITTLRTITPLGRPVIGSVDGGPITDVILENYHTRGPFETENDFNDTLIEAYLKARPLPHMKPYLNGLLSQRKHRIVFTHGDLRPPNVMIQNGGISGIIDWEMSGWYPEYWEFAKALYVWRWMSDWGTCLLTALEPYYSEHLFHALFTDMLW